MAESFGSKIGEPQRHFPCYDPIAKPWAGSFETARVPLPFLTEPREEVVYAHEQRRRPAAAG